MLSRIRVGGVIGAVCLTGAGVLNAFGLASAEPPAPPPPPPAPNINALTPVNPQDYAVYDGSAYVFGSAGLTCMLQRSGGYGCNGPIPGGPDGANLVGGSAGGVPVFGVSPAPMYGGPVNALPPNTRLSFGTVSCGGDGTMTACIDTRNQSGFVVSPAGSYILNEVNPLVARPEGTNPYAN
ncbi:hypothetical protein NGTWS0302_02930 [Mycolicibacterium cyprinidarum]|uniref:Secreted protein n=1 Tax=Mycolicibacterium cyprinidarum TaxID=2860311 RepID=A0ABQ4VAK1_9MYCO|nr:hypothetical protein NGTWS1803_22130 [Mycolicibacterium sp. NGTWS1803]GJF12888.1 hypothetical protein NGTWS0302_02930 [Mycolicibacterium sp. NGTWS0302]GJF14016.1 hypothetical protein NGTWS1702_15230 [Mycolicibacterium sp. NGTWSNA01]